MSNLTISIFGNKIFSEILSELKLFSKFKIKNYQNIDLCIKDSQKGNILSVFFITNTDIRYFDKNAKINFPLILISKSSVLNAISTKELAEKLSIPFTILDFEKIVISLFAKNEFKKNSYIKLADYIIDKNERKIVKNNLELQLSEKEINFLILFSKNSKAISKNSVLQRVWNYSPESETHTVETHIHRLRKKMFEKFGDNNFIKNNKNGYYI